MQYASNRELWDHTRNYRLVCKQWRTWAFKGLKDSKFLPSLALQKHLPTPTTRKSTKKVSWMSKFEENFNTPVKLPIGLIINEKLTKKEIEFIHKYSSMIVHLEVNMYTRNSKKGTEGHLDLILALQLINLQSISVRWARGGEKTKMQLEQFVSHVVGSSRKLQTVKVTYPDHACTGYLPKCPPSVTHIWITGNLQNVIDVMPTRSSHLQALHINLLESEGLHGARFTNILERSSSTLETLKVANYFGNEFRGELQIPTLKCLKTFEVNVPFSLESDSNLPSIQKLLYLLGDDPTFEWPAAETRRLTHVTLKWPDVEPHQQRDIQIRKLEKIYEENCIRKIENEGITLSGKVKGLLLNNLPYRVALAVMPKVYASMLNISKLTLFVSRSIWISRPSTRDSSDLLMMLTGLRPQDVPMDETVWPELLRDKRNAITSLKSKSIHFLNIIWWVAVCNI